MIWRSTKWNTNYKRKKRNVLEKGAKEREQTKRHRLNRTKWERPLSENENSVHTTHFSSAKFSLTLNQEQQNEERMVQWKTEQGNKWMKKEKQSRKSRREEETRQLRNIFKPNNFSFNRSRKSKASNCKAFNEPISSTAWVSELEWAAWVLNMTYIFYEKRAIYHSVYFGLHTFSILK